MDLKAKLIKEISKNLKIKNKITHNTLLDTIEEFDSIGRLTFLAFAEKKYKKNITGDELSACKTIDDILKLLI